MTTEKPPTLTPEQRRRRKARRAWIPSAIIGAIIVGAIVITIVVHASGVGGVAAAHAGDTRFTTAGIAEVRKAAAAQIDVRGARRASAIALPADGDEKFGPFSGVSTELALVGEHGTDSLFVDSFTVKTRSDYLVSISTTSREFGFGNLRRQLEAETVVGITTKQIGAFQDAMPAGAGSPTSHFRLMVGTGRDLGVPTTVSVACAGARGCTVKTVTTLTRP